MADQPTSRRSFLFGRRLLADDPWSRFLARLKRSCEGGVTLVARESAPMARLVPSRPEDVLHALALCRDFKVCMALDGLSLRGPDLSRPVLQVEPGSAWGDCIPLGHERWRIHAGCRLDVIRGLGFSLLDWEHGLSGSASLAELVAHGPRAASPGSLGRFGIEAIELLYPDGTVEILGSFGVADSQPLRSLAAQRSIPLLFQASNDSDLIHWSQNWDKEGRVSGWPLHYRLDALMHLGDSQINLAHLLLGHQGSLGWVLAVHMRLGLDAERLSRHNVQAKGSHKGLAQQVDATRLDRLVKRAMDPDGVFMSSPV